MLLNDSSKFLRKFDEKNVKSVPRTYNFFFIIEKIIPEKNINIIKIMLEIFQFSMKILMPKNNTKNVSLIILRVEKNTPVNLNDSSLIS